MRAAIRYLAVCLVVCEIEFLTLRSEATTYNWTGTGTNTNYNNSTNWSPNTNFPGSSDTAIFNRNANIQYNVTIPGRPITGGPALEAHQLKVGTNTATFLDSVAFNELPRAFSVDAAKSFSNGALIVGDSAGQAAVLETTLANFSTSSVTIGNAAGATGTLRVQGGSFSVTDSNSFATRIGDAGNGTLNVSGGGHASTGHTVLGASVGGVGTVTVSGAESTLSTTSLDVNISGTGTLTVSSGGSVSTSSIHIGNGLAGAATVTGSGSTLSGALLQLHDGTLVIQNSGHVIDDDGHVGPHGSATATVDGIGSTWTNNNSLHVGLGGHGSLNIQNGGHVTAGGLCFVGELLIDQSGSTTGQGDVTIDGTGSNLSVTGDLYVGTLGAATLTLTNNGSATVTGGTFIVGLQGTVNGNSTVTANIMNGGVVAPGTSAGALHVTGNYSQAPGDQLSSAGTLQIELGGTNPGVDYDQLLVSGSFSAVGTLAVSLINSFPPHAGDSFNILDFASMSGTFTNVQLPNLGSMLAWDVSRLYTTGVLSVVSVGVPGDYNNNGIVDAADYVLWRNGGPLANEANAPGTVNGADYTEWRARFGNTSGGGASTTAVPEPGGWAVISATILMFALINRGRPLQSKHLGYFFTDSVDS